MSLTPSQCLVLPVLVVLLLLVLVKRNCLISVLQRYYISITTLSKNTLFPTVLYQWNLFHSFLNQTGVSRCCRMLGLVCFHGEKSDWWLFQIAVLQQAEMRLVCFPGKLLVLAFLTNGCLETRCKLFLSFKPWLHTGNWFWSSRPERRLEASNHDIFLKGHLELFLWYVSLRVAFL